MARKSSVVTKERFAQGYTYQGYLEAIKANREQFERHDQEFQLKEEDAKFFASLGQKLGPLKVVALGEDWCPDVWRGLPIMARIAQAASFELRVFPRDQNLDIMQEYLKDGQFMSMPVFAFYGPRFGTLCHWTERPQAAYAFMDQVRKELEGKPEEAFRAEYRRRTALEVDRWRQETVKEIRELSLYINDVLWHRA